jgi:hypothetical protein
MPPPPPDNDGKVSIFSTDSQSWEYNPNPHCNTERLSTAKHLGRGEAGRTADGQTDSAGRRAGSKTDRETLAAIIPTAVSALPATFASKAVSLTIVVEEPPPADSPAPTVARFAVRLEPDNVRLVHCRQLQTPPSSADYSSHCCQDES